MLNTVLLDIENKKIYDCWFEVNKKKNFKYLNLINYLRFTITYLEKLGFFKLQPYRSCIL